MSDRSGCVRDGWNDGRFLHFLGLYFELDTLFLIGIIGGFSCGRSNVCVIIINIRVGISHYIKKENRDINTGKRTNERN